MRSPHGRLRFMWLSLRGPRSRWRRRPPVARILAALISVAIAVAIPAALTAANTVEASRAGRRDATAGADDIKPIDCASLSLSAIYKGTGAVTGAATNDLILGGPAGQTLDGGDGDDCILGGDGDDHIDGGPGNDVCIGGSGQDTFGADCETTVQGNATF